MAFVTFTYGGNGRQLPSAVGQPASEVIPAVRTVLGVPAGATPEIDGVAVKDTHVFKDGEQVVFYKANGDKGC